MHRRVQGPTVGVRAHRIVEETARPRTFARVLRWLNDHPRALKSALVPPDQIGGGLPVAGATYLRLAPDRQSFTINYGPDPIITWRATGDIEIRLGEDDFRTQWTKGLADRLEMWLENPVSGRARGRWQLGNVTPLPQATTRIHESQLASSGPYQIERRRSWLDPRDLPLSDWPQDPVPPNVPGNTAMLLKRMRAWGPRQVIATVVFAVELAARFIQPPISNAIREGLDLLREYLRGEVAPEQIGEFLEAAEPGQPSNAALIYQLEGGYPALADENARYALLLALLLLAQHHAPAALHEGDHVVQHHLFSRARLIIEWGVRAATEAGRFRVGDPPARAAMIKQRFLDELWRRVHRAFGFVDGFTADLVGTRRSASGRDWSPPVDHDRPPLYEPEYAPGLRLADVEQHREGARPRFGQAQALYLPQGMAPPPQPRQVLQIPGFTFMRAQRFATPAAGPHTVWIYRHDSLWQSLQGRRDSLLPALQRRQQGDPFSKIRSHPAVEFVLIPHSETAEPFLMARTPLVQALWVGLFGAMFLDASRYWLNPVEQVSGEDMDHWFRVTGLRLPSAAEWEHACRGGSTTAYCFGDDPMELPEYAWFSDNADDGQIQPVARLLPNAFGLFDVHGNVWEWCTYRTAYVYRGGSARSFAADCRSAYQSTPASRLLPLRNLGFRPAADIAGAEVGLVEHHVTERHP